VTQGHGASKVEKYLQVHQDWRKTKARDRAEPPRGGIGCLGGTFAENALRAKSDAAQKVSITGFG
jgi:hypothetical protein